jgi:hypothetical protein
MDWLDELQVVQRHGWDKFTGRNTVSMWISTQCIVPGTAPRAGKWHASVRCPARSLHTSAHIASWPIKTAHCVGCQAVRGLWRRCSGVRGRTVRKSRMTVVRTCALRVKVHLGHVDQLGRRGSRIGGRCCFSQTDNMRWAVLAMLATAHARIDQPQQ